VGTALVVDPSDILAALGSNALVDVATLASAAPDQEIRMHPMRIQSCWEHQRGVPGVRCDSEKRGLRCDSFDRLSRQAYRRFRTPGGVSIGEWSIEE
jgi:hypothetical protein